MMKNSFSDLLPERICNVLADQGYSPTGQLFQLNSYENRVYQVYLEDKTQIIAKFYRPQRWSQATLIDEHQVLKALTEAEIPVVRPLALQHFQGFATLGFDEPYYYCLYPKFGGHEKPELSGEYRRWLGRLLARLHNITASLPIKHRILLNTKTYGYGPLKSILDHPYLPPNLKNHLEDTILSCLKSMEPLLNQNWHSFPVHGDCHLSNVLWNAQGPTLVDFDDMVIAPAIQDIWMLFSGTPEEQKEQKKDFFEGYELFREFDESSFVLVETLRTLRMIRHTAWIGERFEEEIFKRAFPYYSATRYWEEFLLNMKEQWSALQMI